MTIKPLLNSNTAADIPREMWGWVVMQSFVFASGIDSISQQSSTRREPIRYPLWLAAAVVLAFLQAGRAALAIEAPVLALGASTRTDYGQLMEPIGDHILTSVGEDIHNYPPFYASFVTAVGVRPAIYTSFLTMGDNATTMAGRVSLLKTHLAGINTPVMVQIGLDMCSTWCTGSNDATAQIAAGTYDANINNVCTGIQSLNVPVYVRIGYEFGGYSQTNYPAAFRRVATILHNCPNTDIATAWVYFPGVSYAAYYPGDAYVDWWGVDTFSVSDFSAVESFMVDSRAHHKPVMIGESTPRGIGAQNEQTSWDSWFVPFFNFIAAEPNIKQVNYINIDWGYPGSPWADWEMRLSLRDR